MTDPEKEKECEHDWWYGKVMDCPPTESKSIPGGEHMKLEVEGQLYELVVREKNGSWDAATPPNEMLPEGMFALMMRSRQLAIEAISRGLQYAASASLDFHQGGLLGESP